MRCELLFEKSISFTDIHFGLKSNSTEHNEDCLAFIKWLCGRAKELGINTCMFLGDWHHSRQTVNIETLNYSYQGMKLLNDNFEKVYFIVGNHDLYFRDNREVSSLVYASDLPNMIYINEPTTFGDVAFYPWLVGEEWKELKSKNFKYVFGHFELPDFYLNSMVKMPHHNELDGEHLMDCGHVYTGHFHKRQQKANITYIGNAFPHDFNDLNDDERGVMVLEWNKEPTFESWPNAPRFRSYDYASLKDNHDKLLNKEPKLNIKMTYDESESTYAEVSNFRDMLVERYDIRNIKVIPKIDAGENDGVEVENAATCDSVDNIVSEQITSMDSGDYDPKYLIQIYNEL